MYSCILIESISGAYATIEMNSISEYAVLRKIYSGIHQLPNDLRPMINAYLLTFGEAIDVESRGTARGAPAVRGEWISTRGGLAS